MSRPVLRASYCLAALFAASLQAQPPERQFVNKYCLGCHSLAARAGNLTLESGAAAERPEVWERVLRRLRGRTMPPAGIPKPDEAS